MTAPVLGPCEAWISGADVQACCPAAASLSPTDPLLDLLAVEASQLLYEISGRRFSGVCEEVVRPAAMLNCGGWAFGSPVGIIPGWQWGNWWSGGGGYGAGWGWGAWNESASAWEQSCSCEPLSEITLAYPVVAVSEVLIGGVVVDPATYRVDEWRYLVRVGDTATGLPRYWPSCQNMAMPSTEAGTWQVTYSHGVAPPPIGARAAAQLACQLYLSCAGGPCQLPTGTTKVTRQGVTIERGLLANWFLVTKFGSGWSTGLPLVDAFLTAYNPKNLKRAPAVMSPDVQQMPRRAGT